MYVKIRLHCLGIDLGVDLTKLIRWVARQQIVLKGYLCA